MNRAFSAWEYFGCLNPGALPRAGMNDAFGVSKSAHNAAAFWPKLKGPSKYGFTAETGRPKNGLDEEKSFICGRVAFG
jgi:hypothetical protein